MTPRATLVPALLTVLMLGTGARAENPAPTQARAVIELFTSQGCSSCPPADALLGELAKDPGIVALTLPVTYWDYLGWKDTLGRDNFTKRQKFYAKARGDGQVYTPQAVINGAAHLIGSNKAEIDAAISQLGPKALTARVALGEEAGNLRIELSPAQGATATSAGVWVLPITRQITVPVMRGENEGKTLSYANVARTMVRVGDWDGTRTTLTVPMSATQAPEADSYAVLVQADQPGKYGMMPGAILGAALAPKRPGF
ncbi:MAG: DUF1223 domain-containing protein [Chelatococcus sp.]|nr:MAG: DUF1223 domain-containing protein [Chelatococcus sp.]